MILVRLRRGIRFGLLALTLLSTSASGTTVEGEPRTWHRVEVHFTGPRHAESDSNPNPFLDYRLQCRFEGPSGQSYDVPGFFDASGGSNPVGTLWICRFAPDEAGTWSYRASFRSGPNVGVSESVDAGSPAAFDGETGSFTVTPSNKSGRDFRSPLRGRLVNVGDRYLTFLGSGDRWIKGGLNIPENLLGYAGFVRTPKAQHKFSAHAGDWRPGDPDWGGGQGRAIIGALNYVADTGGNSIYFLPMNLGGDGRDTFPTIAETDKTHYDTEKLRQWEQVFGHATSKGIFLHFQLNETESANETYHDGGELGIERKLYYRELVARFAHHPGVQWNLGEENDFGASRHRAFATYLKAVDPYDHPVTTHTRVNQMEQYYEPLLGNDDFDTTSFQIGLSALEQGDAVSDWVERSARSGTPWAVSIDEPQRIENDSADPSLGYARGRLFFLWPVYLSGGGGFEWYVQEDGGGHSLDQRLDNFREMELALQWTGHALDFMHELPFWLMEPRPELGNSTAGGKTFVLARPGDSYALYNPMGGSLSLDLSGDRGSYALRWFDPETGRWSAGGSVEAGALADLGAAPFGGDAAALLALEGGDNSPPVASFTVTPSRGDAPLSVRLDGSSSVDDGAIAEYDWKLGDGAATDGAVVNHTYIDAGEYTATLTVTDDQGAKGSGSQKVQVFEAAPAPDDSPPPAIEPELAPTATPPANEDPATEAPAPTPADGYRLVVSQSPLRTDAAPLADASLAGEVYIYVTPGTAVREARFSLDGKPRQIERAAPHDFAGGSVTHANPFDTRSVSNGTHRIRVLLEFEQGQPVVLEEGWFAANPLPPATPPAVPTSAPIEPPNYRLLVSRSPDRTGAIPLAGATLSDLVYVFVSPGRGIREARFFLDGMRGQLERFAPHDFAGGSVAMANPFNTRGIRDGTHGIKAKLELEDGQRAIVEGAWTAANRVPSASSQTTEFWSTSRTQNTAAGGEFRLMVSRSPLRDAPIPLAGAVLSDDVYIFVTPGRGVRQVRFYLDGMKGQLEREAPHDFAGGSETVARPFNTRAVYDGVHRIKAELELEDGRVVAIEDDWTAANRVAAPTAEAPTSMGETGSAAASSFRLSTWNDTDAQCESQESVCMCGTQLCSASKPAPDPTPSLSPTPSGPVSFQLQAPFAQQVSVPGIAVVDVVISTTSSLANSRFDLTWNSSQLAFQSFRGAPGIDANECQSTNCTSSSRRVDITSFVGSGSHYLGSAFFQIRPSVASNQQVSVNVSGSGTQDSIAFVTQNMTRRVPDRLTLISDWRSSRWTPNEILSLYEKHGGIPIGMGHFSNRPAGDDGWTSAGDAVNEAQRIARQQARTVPVFYLYHRSDVASPYNDGHGSCAPNCGWGGVLDSQFNTDWVMRVPRSVRHAIVNRFWNGNASAIGYRPHIDVTRVRALETSSSVPALYGAVVVGSSRSQDRFEATGVVMDLTNAAYREYAANRFIMQIGMMGIDPGEEAIVGLINKPGWHTHRPQTTDSGEVCWTSGSNMWTGPAHSCIRDDGTIKAPGGPLDYTQYGRDAYELAATVFIYEVRRRLDAEGYTEVRLSTVDRPVYEKGWLYLYPQITHEPWLLGEAGPTINEP